MRCMNVRLMKRVYHLAGVMNLPHAHHLAELSKLLELRADCIFPDLPAAARPALPTFVHREGSDGGSREEELGRFNRADCTAMVAVAQQGTAQLAATRSALLTWSAWREKALPLHLAGGTVSVQFRLDKRLPKASSANGAWFSMLIVLPGKAAV